MTETSDGLERTSRGLDWDLMEWQLLVHHSQAGSSWLPGGLQYTDNCH